MPEAGLIFWMFVAFVLLLGILAKFGWPTITKMVDERATLIDKGVEYAEAAKASLEDSETQARAILAEANRQQLEILQEAAQMRPFSKLPLATSALGSLSSHLALG